MLPVNGPPAATLPSALSRPPAPNAGFLLDLVMWLRCAMAHMRCVLKTYSSRLRKSVAPTQQHRCVTLRSSVTELVLSVLRMSSNPTTLCADPQWGSVTRVNTAPVHLLLALSIPSWTTPPCVDLQLGLAMWKRPAGVTMLFVQRTPILITPLCVATPAVHAISRNCALDCLVHALLTDFWAMKRCAALRLDLVIWMRRALV